MRFLVFALLITGIVLRTVQYLGAVSFWHDELALALNFEKYGISELVTQPLDHKQVAPVGFLAAVELASQIFGINEYGLRFISWLFAISSIFLFWRVSGRYVHGAVLLAGLSLFVISPALIWYGASLKQYGSDVTLTLLLVLLALRHWERPHQIREAWIAAVAGGIAFLFSHAAVITGFLISGVLIARWIYRKPRSPLAPLAILCAGWAIGAGIATGMSILVLNPETKRYMHEFWASRGGFPPPVTQFGQYLLWFPKQILSVFSHFLLFITPPVFVVMFALLPILLAAGGVTFLFRKSFWTTALLVSPLAAGLLAAIAGILPFRHRVGLYAGWPILILAMAGIVGMRDRLPGKWKKLASVISVIVALPLTLLVLFAARPPYSGQESRPVLKELVQHYKPDDRIYVFCGARHAINYYGPRLGLIHWNQGGCYAGDPKSYEREVDQFRGKGRVWFFYTQSQNNEAQTVKKYFNSIGQEIHAVPDPDNNHGEIETAAFLFDLSR